MTERKLEEKITIPVKVINTLSSTIVVDFKRHLDAKLGESQSMGDAPKSKPKMFTPDGYPRSLADFD